MPELPEVEMARRNLEKWFRGRELKRAEADARARTFRGADVRAFERLRGRLLKAERKGKYLLLAFERDLGFLSHLGMTGKWVRRGTQDEVRYSRARLFLDDQTVIHYVDPRLFGRIEPAPAHALWALPAISALGPDALLDRVTARSLEAAVGPSRQELKVALMDQSRISGLGNIHAAEALFRARIHPARRPDTLSSQEWRRLADAIHATIEFGISSQDTEEISYVEEPGSENPFQIYGRAGEKCPRCGTTVRSFVQGGRTTHYCPTCQPKRPKR